MGLRISFDVRDLTDLLRAIDKLDTTYRRARFDRLRGEVGWSRKRLARALRVYCARGYLRRIEVSRKNVRYERTLDPFTRALQEKRVPEKDGLLLKAVTMWARNPLRRRRGRPHGPRVPYVRSDVGIAPEDELAAWIDDRMLEDIARLGGPPP